MKSLLLSVLLLLLTATLVNAQGLVMTFAEAKAKNISIEEIDALYMDALHSEPELGLFNTNSGVFINEYRGFITELARFLNTNDFFWEEPTRIFSRIYFSADGEVEYFFLNEAQANLTTEQLEQFTKLTAEFISVYIMEIESDEPFAQCSPVVYDNIKSESF